MKRSIKITFIIVVSIFLVLLFISLISKSPLSNISNEKNSQAEIPTRESKIPSYAIKQNPEIDENPPLSLSDEYENPVPLSSTINTAGAEDSPFIPADFPNTLYFFFTPDVNVPAEKQLLDGVTGIYTSSKSGTDWATPQRIFLNEKGKLTLDGCEFVSRNIMWFCSAREDYTGIHWFSAEFENGRWTNWKNADFPSDYQVGELHISSDAKELYYHSSRPGGKGGLDIWKLTNVNGEWKNPENIEGINSVGDEGWPALSPNGNELWFSKDYTVWRSKKINNEWSQPEKMFSPLAGEPTIDAQGNVYFVHHFFKNNKMIEADIYFARRK